KLPSCTAELEVQVNVTRINKPITAGIEQYLDFWFDTQGPAPVHAVASHTGRDGCWLLASDPNGTQQGARYQASRFRRVRGAYRARYVGIDRPRPAFTAELPGHCGNRHCAAQRNGTDAPLDQAVRPRPLRHVATADYSP
ncbi:MAG TPA: hypothetical protein VH025_11380, partial [Solirubrobacteraceae bacterium]|nr:hypothetical protein [Solirubrobacteraceae bacterium]